MPEISTPPTPPKKARRSIRIVDVVVLVLILVVVVVLAKTLLGQLSLRHEVSGARIVTDKVIADMQKQDASGAHALGDTAFQSENSTKQLSSQFTAAKPYVTGTPQIVKQTVTNGPVADDVSIIYKFGTSKPFYVRVIAARQAGHDNWQLINLNGNPVESKLIITK